MMLKLLHYPVSSLESAGTSEMIGFVFISVSDICLLLHEGKFHHILCIQCLYENLALSLNEPSKKFPVISHASINFQQRDRTG